MNRTQIYLPKQRIETLRREARRRKTTMSELIRQVLDAALDRAPVIKGREREKLLSAARRIGKLGRKGPKDLASQMDKYLYGRR